MLTISRTYSKPKSKDLVKSIFNSICLETRSPVSSLLSSSTDLEISRFRIRPEDYSCAKSFSEDYLLTSFLSKWKGLDTGIDTERTAILAFEKQELTCAEINRRLRARLPTIVDPVLYRAQRLIAKVLGQFEMSKMRGLERWGPGASTDLRRSAAYLDSKISVLPIPVTRGALGELKHVIESDLHWSFVVLGSFPVGDYSLLPHNFAIVEGCHIDTVPKSAKTDRTIGIEPRGNMFLQKAAGNYMRRKLRKFGIDLDDQSLNQRLAAIAQERGLSTIDLSMASDSMVEELIYELLPIEWALYLDSIRSKKYSYDGKTYQKFEKFSSMGNGFTFELESLIFFALAKACQSCDSSELAVYGDDIICHRDDAPTLICVLSYCGFETNLDKTYIEGRFFESCGKHYFDGVDVTPTYQKELVLDYSEHVRFLNRLARYLVRQSFEDPTRFMSTPGFETWKAQIVDHISKWSPLLPLGTEGDDGYLVTASIFQPVKAKRSYGNQWTVSVRSKVTIPGDDAALLAYRLRQNSSGQPNALNHLTSSADIGNMVDLESRSTKGGLSLTTRWIEPPWEYYLN